MVAVNLDQFIKGYTMDNDDFLDKVGECTGKVIVACGTIVICFLTLSGTIVVLFKILKKSILILTS
jgi:hypothetical protein